MAVFQVAFAVQRQPDNSLCPSPPGSIELIFLALSGFDWPQEDDDIYGFWLTRPLSEVCQAWLDPRAQFVLTKSPIGASMTQDEKRTIRAELRRVVSL